MMKKEESENTTNFVVFSCFFCDCSCLAHTQMLGGGGNERKNKKLDSKQTGTNLSERKKAKEKLCHASEISKTFKQFYAQFFSLLFFVQTRRVQQFFSKRATHKHVRRRRKVTIV